MPDALACLAASAAISVSDIPFDGPVSEVRVGKVDGKLIINPSVEENDVILPKATSSLALLKNPTKRNMGELAWRLGLMFAAFNFLIIGLAITSANHRVGRGGNLALALFAFVVYYNFINMSQSWVGTGKFQFLPLLIVLHGGVFMLAFAWLMVRHNNWNWRSLLANSSGKASSK